jgi:hypothetical protein
VLAAALAGEGAEAAARVGEAAARAAQVDDRGQAEAAVGGRAPEASAEDLARALVEPGGRQLDRVRRPPPQVRAVEPAARRVQPRPGAHHAMVVDAELPRLGEGAIGHLEEADRRGGRAVQVERVRAPAPAPERPRQRVAAALHLHQRRQEPGRDDVGGVLAEELP